jgi:SAM-dependent methyltransferase
MNQLLSQTRFPQAWLLAQKLIGGTPDKKRLALRHYSGQRKILEVGCSVGNLADAFLDMNDIIYTGVDIDEAALATARRRFAGNPRFVFRNDPIERLAAENLRWDYVLIAGVLHHVDQPTAEAMIAACVAVVEQGGRLVVSEPVPLRPGDGPVFGLMHRIEQGRFLRETAQLVELLQRAGLNVESCEEPLIGPGLLPSPKIMRFALIKATAAAALPNHSGAS